jgi:hypothetical protein
MIKTFSLVVMASVGMAPLLTAEREHSPIPLEKGTQWIYEAKVQWTPVAGDGPQAAQLFNIPPDQQPPADEMK